MSFWTDERAERLESLWERGYSAGAIAEIMVTTRNTIAGKAWRLQLPEREVLYTVARKSRRKAGRPISLRRRVKVRTPCPRHNGDFSWHFAQVALGVAPRSNPPEPPAGFPSWRTFNRRRAAVPEFNTKVEEMKRAA